MKGGSCGRFAFGDSRRGFLGTGSFCVGGEWRAFKPSAAAFVPHQDSNQGSRGWQKVRLPLGQRRTTGRGRFLGIDTVRPPHTGVLTCTQIQFS